MSSHRCFQSSLELQFVPALPLPLFRILTSLWQWDNWLLVASVCIYIMAQFLQFAARLIAMPVSHVAFCLSCLPSWNLPSEVIIGKLVVVEVVVYTGKCEVGGHSESITLAPSPSSIHPCWLQVHPEQWLGRRSVCFFVWDVGCCVEHRLQRMREKAFGSACLQWMFLWAFRSLACLVMDLPKCLKASTSVVDQLTRYVNLSSGHRHSHLFKILRQALTV